ncbi:MAG: rhodanese-like domain-containing protein [Ignavibacteriales bacterium]|nr:rhodanese-like domain-containing protein [Ignavibacteriales bacterium]
MKDFYANLSLNKKLGLFAFVLGFLALFAGSPYHGSEATVNAKELALIVEKEVDHVSVQTLADWIIQGKSDFRLIDLRNEKDFAEYHVPSAENVPLSGLDQSNLQHNEKIILYSDGGIHSAQAWMLLAAKGFKGVYILRGGLEEWKDQILFPHIPENLTPAQVVEFAKTKEVSKFFGGAPQSGGTTDAATPKLAMPKLEAPAGAQSKAAPTKKKKEGC